MDLSGKTAFVTGAAHRIGKGIALELAKNQCNIILHYGRSGDMAKQTKAEIENLGVEVDLISADLQDTLAIENMMEEIHESFSYQILVNSAASFVKNDFDTTTLEQFDIAINTNLRAPYFLIQHAWSSLRKQSDAVIVNIGDLSGIYPWKSFSAHGVSKAGLIHLTKILARELAPTRVNAVIPGPIMPPPHISEADEVWQEMVKNIPMQKSGQPSDIGKAIVYFATNEFVTGAILHVDGGEGLVGPKNH